MDTIVTETQEICIEKEEKEYILEVNNVERPISMSIIGMAKSAQCEKLSLNFHELFSTVSMEIYKYKNREKVYDKVYSPSFLDFQSQYCLLDNKRYLNTPLFMCCPITEPFFTFIHRQFEYNKRLINSNISNTSDVVYANFNKVVFKFTTKSLSEYLKQYRNESTINMLDIISSETERIKVLDEFYIYYQQIISDD